MNLWDILLSGLILAALAAAAAFCARSGDGGSGCGGNCSGCARGCGKHGDAERKKRLAKSRDSR